MTQEQDPMTPQPEQQPDVGGANTPDQSGTTTVTENQVEQYFSGMLEERQLMQKAVETENMMRARRESESEADYDTRMAQMDVYLAHEVGDVSPDVEDAQAAYKTSEAVVLLQTVESEMRSNRRLRLFLESTTAERARLLDELTPEDQTIIRAWQKQLNAVTYWYEMAQRYQYSAAGIAEGLQNLDSKMVGKLLDDYSESRLAGEVLDGHWRRRMAMSTGEDGAVSHETEVKLLAEEIGDSYTKGQAEIQRQYEKLKWQEVDAVECLSTYQKAEFEATTILEQFKNVVKLNDQMVSDYRPAINKVKSGFKPAEVKLSVLVRDFSDRLTGLDLEKELDPQRLVELVALYESVGEKTKQKNQLATLRGSVDRGLKVARDATLREKGAREKLGSTMIEIALEEDIGSDKIPSIVQQKLRQAVRNPDYLNSDYDEVSLRAWEKIAMEEFAELDDTRLEEIIVLFDSNAEFMARQYLPGSDADDAWRDADPTGWQQVQNLADGIFQESQPTTQAETEQLLGQVMQRRKAFFEALGQLDTVPSDTDIARYRQEWQGMEVAENRLLERYVAQLDAELITRYPYLSESGERLTRYVVSEMTHLRQREKQNSGDIVSGERLELLEDVVHFMDISDRWEQDIARETLEQVRDSLASENKNETELGKQLTEDEQTRFERMLVDELYAESLKYEAQLRDPEMRGTASLYYSKIADMLSERQRSLGLEPVATIAAPWKIDSEIMLLANLPAGSLSPEQEERLAGLRARRVELISNGTWVGDTEEERMVFWNSLSDVQLHALREDVKTWGAVGSGLYSELGRYIDKRFGLLHRPDQAAVDAARGSLGLDATNYETEIHNRVHGLMENYLAETGKTLLTTKKLLDERVEGADQGERRQLEEQLRTLVLKKF